MVKPCRCALDCGFGREMGIFVGRHTHSDWELGFVKRANRTNRAIPLLMDAVVQQHLRSSVCLPLTPTCVSSRVFCVRASGKISSFGSLLVIPQHSAQQYLGTNCAVSSSATYGRLVFRSLTNLLGCNIPAGYGSLHPSSRRRSCWLEPDDLCNTNHALLH